MKLPEQFPKSNITCKDSKGYSLNDDIFCVWLDCNLCKNVSRVPCEDTCGFRNAVEFTQVFKLIKACIDTTTIAIDSPVTNVMSTLLFDSSYSVFIIVILIYLSFLFCFGVFFLGGGIEGNIRAKFIFLSSANITILI